MREPINPTLYVIVRRDLSETYRMVQGAHGVASFALKEPEQLKEWKNGYICFLSVFNGLALKELNRTLQSKDIHPAHFIEPDLSDAGELTSLVLFENGSGVVKKALKNLPLA